MREAASRGFFLASIAPFGYKRVKVSDGAKERPTLEVDPGALRSYALGCISLPFPHTLPHIQRARIP